MKAKLICISGLDGSGKTTQAKILQNYLSEQGTKCEFIAPFNTIIMSELTSSMTYQRKIIKYLKDNDLPTEAFHYASVIVFARELNAKIIKPKLEKGVSVIVDRYYESSLLNLYLLGYDISDKFELFSTLYIPDLWVYLDVNALECYRRINERGAKILEMYESLDGLKNQEEFYNNVANQLSFVSLKGTDSIEAISLNIAAVVDGLS